MKKTLNFFTFVLTFLSFQYSMTQNATITYTSKMQGVSLLKRQTKSLWKNYTSSSLLTKILIPTGVGYYLYNFNNTNTAITETAYQLGHDLTSPQEIKILGSVTSLIFLKAYIDRKPNENFIVPLKKCFGEVLAFAAFKGLIGTPAFQDFFNALTTSYHNCQIPLNNVSKIEKKQQTEAQSLFLSLAPLSKINFQKSKSNNKEKLNPLGRTLILFGPPGTGKTSIVSTYLKENEKFISGFLLPKEFIHKPSEIVRQFAGLIRYFERIHYITGKDILIFIDEIDQLVPNRFAQNAGGLGSQVTAAFLQFLDKLFSTDDIKKHEWIHIVGVTNSLESIDPAQLSRFINGPGLNGKGGGYGCRNKDMLYSCINFENINSNQKIKDFREKENLDAAKEESFWTENELKMLRKEFKPFN